VLKLAADKNPNSEHLYVRLAGVYSALGEVNLALQAAEGAIKADPASLLGYQNLYALRLRGGQTNEAWVVLERASSGLQLSAEQLTDLAELWTNLGRHVPNRAAECKGRSVQLLDRAASLNPTNQTAMLRIAEGYFLFEEYSKALPWYERLLQDYMFPELVRDSLRAKLTAIYVQTGQREKAAEQLRSILTEDPLNVQAHLQLSHLAMDDKKFAEAADHMKQVVALRPDVEGMYYDLARLQLDADDAQGTLSTLDRARARFSRNFWGEYLAAIAFTRLKEPTNALTHFTAAEVIAGATDTNRLTYQFYFQMGAARERIGDFKGAEASFLRCLELSPDFASALNYLGYMWADRNENLDRAKEMIERALKQEPENEAYVDSMAWVLYRRGETAAALEWLLKAVKLSEQPDAEILDHLGEVYEKLGQKDKAVEAWKRSLAVEPKDSVRKKLEAMQDK
jgi:tetratricopeptide (TPR) repeat protein